MVDLALLDRGFHIVTGPVPYNADGPSLPSWNAVYNLLTSHGFSKKPVLEGAGGAAGEAYAWAIANPDKVSCIYGENPGAPLHHDESAAARQPGPAGQSRRPRVARLWQPRSDVREPDAGGGETLQGTRRLDDGHRARRRGTLPDRARRTQSRSLILSSANKTVSCALFWVARLPQFVDIVMSQSGRDWLPVLGSRRQHDIDRTLQVAQVAW